MPIVAFDILALPFATILEIDQTNDARVAIMGLMAITSVSVVSNLRAHRDITFLTS
ncbi:hypothetical protein [Pyrobaculum islandicum]|uniref:hypothetical protein n=1 Tax=Pyrobaculum islandicum TaxID=2277 RepID=UPI000A6402C4|nr:hypothetical protein [Pyrobaculum islandicum]